MNRDLVGGGIHLTNHPGGRCSGPFRHDADKSRGLLMGGSIGLASSVPSPHYAGKPPTMSAVSAVSSPRLADVLPLALRAIAEPHTNEYRIHANDGYLAQRIQQISKGTISLGGQAVMELVWTMVSRGFAYIDTSQPSPTYWTVQLTERGIRALDDSGSNPDDVPAYLTKLAEKVPGLSPTAKLYLEEALRCYSTDNHLAATMMLGVATEAVFYDTALSFADWIPDGSGAKLHELLERPGAAFVHKFSEFQKRVAVHKSAIPADLAQNVDLSMNSLLELIRLARNEVGHPTGVTVARENCFQYLVVFPLLAGRLYAIRQHCLKDLRKRKRRATSSPGPSVQ